jgi:hypothetical protein
MNARWAWWVRGWARGARLAPLLLLLLLLLFLLLLGLPTIDLAAAVGTWRG